MFGLVIYKSASHKYDPSMKSFLAKTADEILLNLSLLIKIKYVSINNKIKNIIHSYLRFGVILKCI